MRRTLPLLTIAALALAACTSGDEDTISEMSLIDISSTEVPPVDKCATEETSSTDVPAAPAGSEPSGGAPSGGEPEGSDASVSQATTEPPAPSASSEPSATAEASESSEPSTASEPTASSEPTGSSEPTASSEPVSTDPFASAPDVSLPAEIPTELVVTVLEEGPGEGPAAGEGDIVKVYYSGELTETGEVFDANYGTGSPFAVTLGPTAGVIDGWKEGLVGVQAGDRIQLDIPSDLAYGDEGRPPTIPGGAALTFVIDVVDVISIDYPTEAPTELEKTTITEGPADGRAAQWYDTVTFDAVIGAPAFAFETTSSSAPGSSEPESSSAGSSSVAESSEPAPSAAESSGPESSPAATTTPETSGATPETSAPEASAPETSAATTPETSTPDTSATDSSGPATSATDASTPDDSAVPASSEPGEAAAGGTVVFSSFDSDPSTGAPGAPVTLLLARGETGIPGLEEGLQGARPGDRFQLDVPGELGLGDAGAGLGLPADAPIVIWVDVIDVTGPPTIDVPDEIPTELQVTTLEEGSGPAAQAGDTVLVNYVGVVTETNERIGSNWESTPQPLVLGEGTTIPGWEEGLVGVHAGDQIQIDVPADMAYGGEGIPADSLPGDTALSFLVDVAAVIPATSSEDAPTDLDLPLSSTPVEEVVTDDVVEGTGDEVTLGQTAIVNVYAVCATNGAVLQDTWGDSEREFITLSSGAVIEGLITGISGMKVGGTRIITVPAAQAFADAGSTELGVGPDRDLIFVVELYGAI
jgi:FKBP-type peptidyl-prolyl cis-trans isomerase